MTHNLTFTTLHQYNTREVGITVPVRLSFGERSVDVSTKLDTGASLCIFQRGLGEALGLDIETGHPQEISTPTGSFITYGHELTLSVLNFHFDTTVYFAVDYTLLRNVLGRQGWLDRLKIGIIDYDGKLYISNYDYNDVKE